MICVILTCPYDALYPTRDPVPSPSQVYISIQMTNAKSSIITITFTSIKSDINHKLDMVLILIKNKNNTATLQQKINVGCVSLNSSLHQISFTEIKHLTCFLIYQFKASTLVHIFFWSHKAAGYHS